MKHFGTTSLSAFLGDFIVYRTLTPMDPRLPRLGDLRAAVGLQGGDLPRKSEPAYARVMVYLLQRARGLDAPRARIRRLVYIGDTRMNDGTAFTNLCRAGDWPGVVFIGAETADPAQVDVIEAEGRVWVLANRWSALSDLEAICTEHGVPIDEQTAVVIDLDKTALGARGRNDHVINRVRLEASRETVAEALGPAFDATAFRRAYDRFNQSAFHPFTTDNQDYLVYLCLMVGSPLYEVETLVAAIRGGRFETFAQFMAEVEARAHALPSRLREVHAHVYARVQQGDPTPFKAFRRREYKATVARMDCTSADSVTQLLDESLVITEEVRRLALRWRRQGALLFGLSDKPDEASLPTPALAEQGYLPIHQINTHVVGEGDA
ncbi:MAG: hypothetical protein ACP5HM_04665 [Anaerolineae bacterium]